MIARHGIGIRVVHWTVAASFLYLLLSGAGLAAPALYWLTTLCGGGTVVRWLHPWVGLVFSAGLAVLALSWIRDMGMGPADARWLARFRTYLSHGDMPETGRFNPGQKLFYWAAVAAGAALLVSGWILWTPASGSSWLPSMHLLHTVGFVVLACGFVYHLYFSTFAFPGTLRAMVRGTVTRAWAERHHGRWAREQRE